MVTRNELFEKYFFVGQNSSAVGFVCSLLRKKYLSVRSHELLPRKCGKLVFLASKWFGAFSLGSIQSNVSRFSRGPIAGNHRQQATYSLQLGLPTGSNTMISKLFRSDGRSIIVRVINRIWPSLIEKVVLTEIPRNSAPGEAGNNSGQIMEKLLLILTRGRQIYNIYFRTKSSCERAERFLFNRLQLQLHGLTNTR